MAMIGLVILGLFVLVFFGYGTSLFFLKKADSYERIVSSASLGFGILAFIVFILNQFLKIKFNFTVSIAILIVFFIAGAIFIFINRKYVFKKTLKKANKEKANKKNNFFKQNWFILLLIFIMLLIIYHKALFLPIVNSDTLGFHAPSTENTFNTGELPSDVGPAMSEFTRAYPPLLIILGSWLNILNQEYHDIFLQLITFISGILVLAVTYLLAKNLVFKDKRKALLACLLLLTIPAFVNYSIMVSNDVIFAFFGLLGIYFIMKYLQSKEKNVSYLVLGFINLGFSINTKQLGLPFALSVILGLVFILFFRKFWKKEKKIFKSILISKELKHLILGGIILLIIIAPYFVRNTVEFGDPIYPYLAVASPAVEGKNFVAFIYEPTRISMDSQKITASFEYVLFGIVNFMKSKSYSMSVFLLLLLVLTLINWKKLKNEQKYLIYFSIFFTLYYVYSFLVKYRYYVVIIPLLCVFVADTLDNILFKKKLGARQKNFFIISITILLLILLAYFIVLINKEIFIQMLGFRAEYFLSSPDFLIIMHLLVPILASMFVLVLKNARAGTTRTIKAVIVAVILLVPAVYGASYIKWGVVSETTGWLNSDKNLGLYKQEFFKPLPSKDNAMIVYFGEDYFNAVYYLNENTPIDSKIVLYQIASHHVKRSTLHVDSYKLEQTLNTDLATTLEVLKELGITHVFYKVPGWDEAVFEKGELYSQSYITKNLDNPEVFKPVFVSDSYIVYESVFG